MKKIKMISAICAVAGALFAAGCATAVQEEKTVETPAVISHATVIEPAQAAEVLKGEAIPNWGVTGVHVSSELSPIFHVDQPADVNYDEDGMLRVRVVADTDELPFFTWLFFPNRTYKFTYRFIWFDESGKIQKGATPVDCREVMPGDPVRFSAKATDVKVKKFALILAPGCSGTCEKAAATTAAAEKK